MKLLDLVARETIVPELTASDRNGCVHELVERIAQIGGIGPADVESVVKLILKRERSRGTTGFGKGVAVPHARVPGLPRPVAAVGRSSRGLDFNSLDGGPVFGVILLLSPEEPAEQHLRAMDLVFRLMQQERFRKFLRQSDTVEKILVLLQEADERTPAL